jgi:hypothetical protein
MNQNFQNFMKNHQIIEGLSPLLFFKTKKVTQIPQNCFWRIGLIVLLTHCQQINNTAILEYD